MATVILSTDTNATHAAGAGESTVIPQGVIRASVAGDAIDISALGVTLTVDGAIYGGADGVDVDATNTRIIVGETGLIRAVNSNVSTAINVPVSFATGLSITNYGEISGVQPLDADATNSTTLANHGVMSGSASGVSVGASSRITNTGLIEGLNAFAIWSPGNNVELVNHGTVIGYSGAVQLAQNAAVTNHGTITSVDGDGIYMQSGTVFNYGTIAGGTASASSNYGIEFNQSAASTVVNAGNILGDVVFKTSADTYKGRGDGHVEGTVLGGAGADTLIGGALADDLSGQNGNDMLRGRGGDDLLKGGFDNDTLRGGAGDDTLEGGNDNDILRGGSGNDALDGGHQADDLHGGQGDDTVDGGNGADVIRGGQGDDMLIGGQGADVFVLTRRSDDDVIADFKDGVDLIDISGFGFVAGDYGTAVAPALSASGATAVRLDLVALGGNGTLLIQGTTLGDMDAADFLF